MEKCITMSDYKNISHANEDSNFEHLDSLARINYNFHKLYVNNKKRYDIL